MAGPFDNRFQQPRTIMNMGGGIPLPSRLELGSAAYRKQREEEERLRQEEALRQRLANPGGRMPAAARDQAQGLLAQREENRAAALMNQGDSSFGRSRSAPTAPIIPRQQRAMQHPGFDRHAYTGATPKSGTFSPSLLSSLRKNPEEEDEFMSWDDQMFLLSLMEGMQGGKPPTPYGMAVGGGNKPWAPLPFPRMA
jgi:hypothetical protein